MPAYNFQSRFAPPILSGAKFTAIRRNPAKVGSTAYLFTGMRTKACKLLGYSEIVRCDHITIGRKDNGMANIKLGSRQLSVIAANDIARRDGFDTAEDMVEWFEATYKLPINRTGCAHDVFDGFLIEWMGW